MPDPADLHAHHGGGMTYLLAGSVTLACWRDGDLGMRNIAAAVARQLGFPGTTVAEVLGLSANYVATLRQRALTEGTAGLVRPSGPKPKAAPRPPEARKNTGPPRHARGSTPPAAPP